MRRKNAYLVIVSTRVDEALAIVRIVRLRVRRKRAEVELAWKRRRRRVRRVVIERQRWVGQVLGRLKIGNSR